MKASYIILTAVLISFSTFAQEIVLNNFPGELYQEPKGPGSKHYFHPYISLGVIPDIDEQPGTKINIFFSHEYTIGLRYKRKVLSFYQIGFDVSGRFLLYRIEDEESGPDILNPFSQYWEKGKQNLRTNSVGLEFYNRLKAGKGNNLGYYLDAGVRGDWNYMNKLVVRSKYDVNDNPAGKVKIVNRKLDFMERTALSASGRIGFKKVILYGSYRLSDIFNDKYSVPELPRMVFGIQWGI